jgi:hypothetical protein
VGGRLADPLEVGLPVPQGVVGVVVLGDNHATERPQRVRLL